jgi:hypothetical protein
LLAIDKALPSTRILPSQLSITHWDVVLYALVVTQTFIDNRKIELNPLIGNII